MEFLNVLAGGWAIIWTALAFFILVATVEHEQGVASIVVLAIAVLVLELTGATALAAWVVANPVAVVGYAFLYFIAGGAWSLLKWWLFVRRQADRIKEKFDLWVKHNPDQPKSEFYASSYNPANLGENKDRIMLWMMWWVPSLFWAIASDLIIGIWNRVYDLMAGGFRAIMQRIVGNVIGQ